MLKHLFRLIFRLAGWYMDPNVPPAVFGRCVMVAAPHTSNLDAIYTLAAFKEMGIDLRFAIKRELNVFPIGFFLRSAGAMWINRTGTARSEKRKSYVEAMAELFEGEEKLVMLIAPEGTRSYNSQWKLGFYHLAVKLNLPIALGYLDYDKKQAGVGKVIYPSSDIDADMREIMDFYRNIPAKHPHKFALDERYA